VTSRYDLMQESLVLDEDGQKWPDPLLDFNTGSMSKIPTEYQITNRDLQRFWVCMYEQYGMTELDDMWLNINGIKYLMDLKPGDILYKVSQNELTSFLSNKQIGYEDD